jgi:hypothetical protein
MTTKPRTNSQLARSLVNQQGWGTINSCKATVPNVWHASCAGHGGLVAPLAAVNCDLTREALRSLNVVWTVWQVPGKKPYWDRPGSTWYGDQIRNWPGATSAEWVVGEEDCDWALVVAALPEAVATLSNPANGLASAIQLIDTYHSGGNTVTDGVCVWASHELLIDRLNLLRLAA